MNAKEKFVPQRRFKKFKNGYDWEKRKLCNIVTNISDGDWIESQHIFNDGEYRIIQTGNLGEGIYIDKTNNAKFFYQKDFNQLNANEIFPGDILISRLAEPAGRTIILPNTGKRMVTSVDVTVIRPDDQNFDSMFLMTQMNSSKVLNEVNKSVAGTTHKRISRKNLEQIDLYVPHLAEQTVLGAFFKQIDNIIDLQKNKLDKSKELKSAYLSEMFPAEGERKPKRRFAGFTDDWKQRTFKDMLDNNDGVRRGPFGSALKKDIFVENSGYVVYEQQNAIYDNYKTRYNISKEKYDELNKFSLKENDFIMSGAGTIGRISRVPKGIKPGVFNQALIRFRINTELTDPEYFLQFIRAENMQRKLTGANPGSAISNLVPMSEVKKWEIFVPVKAEQSQIGSFFKQLDDNIALHQYKLEKLQNIKQAYLNEMFI